MKTTHELLIILRDNIEVEKYWFGLKQRIYTGLCRETGVLCHRKFYTYEEMCSIDKYISNTAPKKDKYRYNWPRSLWKPRLKWLNEHIELTKPK